MRNENHLLKLQDKNLNLISLDIINANNNTSMAGSTSLNTAAVKEWWKKKRRNNQDLLLAAEYGSLEEVKGLLDKEGPLGDQVADVNARGLD